jgi:hypothetical protein
LPDPHKNSNRFSHEGQLNIFFLKKQGKSGTLLPLYRARMCKVLRIQLDNNDFGNNNCFMFVYIIDSIGLRYVSILLSF